jgi:uncharacterized OB-fold protein
MSTSEQNSPQRIPVVKERLKISDDGTEGVLLGMKCQECGEHFFGAPSFCLKCTSDNLKPIELSKEGVVTTYTIVRQAPPGWQGDVPYLLAAVQVPEGPRVTAEVVDCPEEAIKVGLPVELTVRVGGKDKEENEVVVYKWKPQSS